MKSQGLLLLLIITIIGSNLQEHVFAVEQDPSVVSGVATMSGHAVGSREEPSAAYQRMAFTASAGHQGRSPMPPPTSNLAENITTFTGDSGGFYDQYRNNSALPNGRMRFEIPIGRYLSPLITSESLRPEGWLKDADWTNLVNKRILPSSVTLSMAAFDVDEDGDNVVPCPERDLIYVNGHLLTDQDAPNGTPYHITGSNDIWSFDAVSFPSKYLKFPIAQGSSTNPPASVTNIVEVAVDTECSHWAVEIDDIQTSTTTVTAPPYQATFVQPLTLTANGTKVVVYPIDQASASVTSLTSSVPVNFTLMTPSNSVITPAIAASDPAITYTEDIDNTSSTPRWIYVYEVANPASGIWKSTTTSPTAGSAQVTNFVATNTLLCAFSNKVQYVVGETATVHVGLATGTTFTSGSAITGTIRYSGLTTSTLTFYDNGTHGDTTSGDGNASGQFTIPNKIGYAAIALVVTKGLVQRIDSLGFAIGTQTGQIQGTLTAATSDANGNGLFDTLDITVPYVTTASGYFRVDGILVDATGQYTTTASATTRDTSTTPIAAGSHTLTLSFNGKELRNSGKNGPYKLVRVALSDTTKSNFAVDARTNAFTSSAYQARQFEGPLLSLTGGSVQPLDLNGNSLYDQLDVRLTLDVLRPGNYGWNGRLIDSQGKDLGWAKGNGYLTTGTPLLFSFDGRRIGASGLNGPYTLTNVDVYQTSGVTSNYTATAIFDNAYTTPAYTAAQFESTAACAPAPRSSIMPIPPLPIPLPSLKARLRVLRHHPARWAPAVSRNRLETTRSGCPS